MICVFVEMGDGGRGLGDHGDFSAGASEFFGEETRYGFESADCGMEAVGAEEDFHVSRFRIDGWVDGVEVTLPGSKMAGAWRWDQARLVGWASRRVATSEIGRPTTLK